MSEASGDHLNRLMRGIATDHVETVRDGWRALVAEGGGVVDVVRAKLDSDVWGQAPRGPAAKYLGVLLALLHEIDASAFASEIARLRAETLNPYHRRTVDLMARRIEDAPSCRIAGDLPVYIAPDIADRALVAESVQRWSRTPGLDLGGVTRIDVIAKRPDMDYLGRYNLFFSGIVLTWPTAAVRRAWRPFVRLDAEFTFYHEVGHHACGHIEHGQVAEQEAEANAYASAAIRRAHPVLSRVAWVLLAPLRPLLLRLTKTSAG